MAANGERKGKNGQGGGPPQTTGAPTNGKASDEPHDAAPAGKAPPKALTAGVANVAKPKAEAPAEPPKIAVVPVVEALPEQSTPPLSAKHEPPRGAKWADPIARFETKWTWFESRLITFVLLWQLFALVSWVFLNGLSESVSQSAGVVFRAVGAAVALGLAAWHFGKKLGEDKRRALTIVALVTGLVFAGVWRGFVLASQKPDAAGLAVSLAALDKSQVDYFNNMKGWLQEGSTLTLMGGLRGLGTRLTLWLALLGGSLATAAGKHIHIDVIFRFLPTKLRIPAAIVNYTAAALVCVAGAWGFFDHIAIESYGSKADDSAMEKIARAKHEISDHLFFTWKQVGLDARSLPHVLAGQRYDQWMNGVTWNTWVSDAGFESRFKPEEIDTIRVPPETPTHTPYVVSPAGETTRGILVHTLSLVFPFGLLAIGLRFLLRALLTVSGHISADPDEAHKEELKSAARTGLEGGV